MVLRRTVPELVWMAHDLTRPSRPGNSSSILPSLQLCLGVLSSNECNISDLQQRRLRGIAAMGRLQIQQIFSPPSVPDVGHQSLSVAPPPGHLLFVRCWMVSLSWKWLRRQAGQSFTSRSQNPPHQAALSTMNRQVMPFLRRTSVATFQSSFTS